VKHPGAIAGRERAPRRQRRPRSRDRRIDLRGTGAVDLGEHRLGGRLEDCQSFAQRTCPIRRAIRRRSAVESTI
jgi:hypothetical protein